MTTNKTIVYADTSYDDITIAPEDGYPEVDNVDKNWFNQSWAWVMDHKSEIISVTGFTSTLAYYVTQNIKNNKKLRDINNGVGSMNSIVGSQERVTDATAQMILGFNDFAEKFNDYESNFAANKHALAECQKQVIESNALCRTLLEVLSYVYANSNLPQSVKDVVNFKYASALKDVAVIEESKETKEHIETTEV